MKVAKLGQSGYDALVKQSVPIAEGAKKGEA
jgi:hypothetical protein